MKGKALQKRLLGWLMMATVCASLGGGCGGDYYGDYVHAPMPRQDGEKYEALEENDFIATEDEPVSTFAIDVDNGSYTLMRSSLNNSQLPNPDGVRPEEFINFFDYDYPEPADEHPFSVNLEVAPSHFGDELHLLRVGLQGRHLSNEDLKPSNLVFLVDVSGSMKGANRIGLVKESLHILLDHLRPSDTVGIVTYAGKERVVLRPTPVRERRKIKRAINNLGTGGSTNGEAGIVKAYRLAEQAKIEGGNNRVIITTDGDFNVGKTGDELVQLIRDYREKHISLTAVGYGRGNYNDATMEALARNGNGNYFYVDNVDEAERIFGTELASTLQVIAADVKIQVEFAPDTVARYRLIGYENRMLDNQDFDDDAKDAGEIGPGHRVTALYELELEPETQSETGLLAEVRLRYKDQYGEQSKLIERGIKLSQAQESFDEASNGFRFAAAVAEFSEILRESKHSEGARFTEVHDIADGASSGDSKQTEFLELVKKAQSLWGSNP